MRLIAVPFSSPGEFLAHYSDKRAGGALFVRTRATFELYETLLLEVSWPGMPNRVVLRASVVSDVPRKGVWAELDQLDSTTKQFMLAIARGDLDSRTKLPRHSERFPAAFPVGLRIADTDQASGDGHTEDLGRGGAFVRTKSPLPPIGTPVELIFDQLSGDTLRLDAEVAWVRDGGEAGGVGVRFANGTQAGLRRLRTLLRRASETGRLQLAE